MKKSSVIFFDYDGVIIDSAFEKYCLALHVLDKKNFELFQEEKNLKTYKNSEEYQNFKNLIPVIGDIGENALALELARNNLINCNEINRSKFLKIISHKKLVKNYDEESIKARTLFMSNADLYKKICPVFDSVIKVIKKYSNIKDIELCICSTKPYKNIMELNRLFNLTNYFSHIKSVVGCESKIAYIDSYVGQSNYEKIIFIDDFLRHLDHKSNNDIVKIFAKWGYDKEKPKKASKIISANLDSLTKIIDESLHSLEVNYDN
jgi:phosphoglycolate phosphatase-like HAD superfamily hydrolase